MFFKKISRSIFKYKKCFITTTYRLHTKCTRVYLQRVVFSKGQAYFEFLGLFCCCCCSCVCLGFLIFWTYMCISRSSVMYCIWQSDLERECKGSEAQKKKWRQQTSAFFFFWLISLNVILISTSRSKYTRVKIHTNILNDTAEHCHSIYNFNIRQKKELTIDILCYH